MVIGAALCAVYVYQVSKLRYIDHDYDIFVGIITGLFFPLVAPFSITIVLVKRYIEANNNK